tara:strand:- start:2787 stop:4013 length:1227 start_codon:yes stop_codon:yes gene_type:complete
MLRQDWLATAMAAAASKNDGGVLQRALLIRQQTETLTRYCGVLKLLHDYENTMANDAVRLVSTRFPVDLLPRTKQYVMQGLANSLSSFVHGVHSASMATSVPTLRSKQPGVHLCNSEWATSLATSLYNEFKSVLDGQTAMKARTTMLRLLEDLATLAIEEEQSRLREVSECCSCVRTACVLFGRRLLSCKKRSCGAARQKAARSWLAATRREVTSEALVTCRPWLTGVTEMVSVFDANGPLDDDAAEGLYACMEAEHDKLATALAFELRRINWLLSASPESPCWSGLVITPDQCDHAFDERVLTPPPHLGSFATGRLRVTADPRSLFTAFSCGLAVVRVARLLAQLLRDGHLPVDRLGRSFANRVVVYEFAKYEHAVIRIEGDTLVPFGRLVGVPYKCGVVSEALSNE